MSNPIPGDDAERTVYEYGPEGMPRVERMPDAVLDCLINHSLFRYFAAGLEGEGRQRLYALLHDTANETLARVSAWPAAPVTADVAADDEGAEPTWRTSDISWICRHLTENTSFSGESLQREWDAMKALALAAGAPAETAKAVKLLQEARYLDDHCEIAPVDSISRDFENLAQPIANFLDATTAPVANDDLNEALAGMFRKIGGTGPCPVQFATPSPSAEVARDAAMLDYLISMVPTRFELIDQKWYLLDPRGRIAGKGSTKRNAILAAMKLQAPEKEKP